jgi:hypothetical protein
MDPDSKGLTKVKTKMKTGFSYWMLLQISHPTTTHSGHLDRDFPYPEWSSSRVSTDNGSIPIPEEVCAYQLLQTCGV